MKTEQDFTSSRFVLELSVLCGSHDFPKSSAKSLSHDHLVDSQQSEGAVSVLKEE